MAIWQRLTTNQRLVTSQTLVQLIGKIVTVIGTFFVIRLLTSESGLGEQGYNQYVLITVYVAYFYLALDFGFNTIFVRWATRDPERKSDYFSQLLSFRLLLSGAMIVLALILLSFLPSDPYTPAIKLGIIATLSTVALHAMFMTGNAYFQLELKYQWSVLIAVTAAVLNLAATYLAIKLGFGLSGVLVAYIAEFVILGLGGLVISRRYLPWRLVVNWPQWKRLFIESLPLGVSIMLTLFYFKSDIFLLSVLPLPNDVGYGKDDAVGLYNLSFSMLEVILTLSAFIMNATYPLMLRAFEQGTDSLMGLVRKSISANFALSLVISVGVLITAPIAISLQTIDNPHFEPSVALLRILALGLPAFFVTNVLAYTLITMDRTRWLPWIYVMAGVLNIAANLWLIPRFGPVAAAMTTVMTEVFVLLLLGVAVWSAVGHVRQDGVRAEVTI